MVSVGEVGVGGGMERGRGERVLREEQQERQFILKDLLFWFVV